MNAQKVKAISFAINQAVTFRDGYKPGEERDARLQLLGSGMSVELYGVDAFELLEGLIATLAEKLHREVQS